MWYTIIAVLGVALVSVVGSLFVNASSWQVGSFWATQPWLADEWEDENREAMVAAREIVRFAARPMTVNVSLTRTTRRRRTPISSIPTTEKPEKATTKRMHRQPLSTIGPNHVCSRSFYTYCPVLNQEAYYSAREGRCLLTTADAVRVCNHSPNRFASIDACYNSCGRMHGPMADRCFEKTLFTDCNRQDVWQNWWVFSGEDCVQWGFPRGLCPDDDGSDVVVFADEAACVERCLSSKDGGENRRCRRPKAKSCTEEQLRFPYFAEILASGRGHCVKATVENLLMHRCLIGANQFNSVSACREACERTKT
ncbi:hypothetical protein HPB51_029833 [Rhipicephalus microplus]|uniref:Uncharacterized protein n=1 Tax=Rhipicephalus microplus TaxID=6941 RepID=A0A9J6CTA9_RHIMP|nr:hypothetical protein HPB51_029833 [Rhipicephalus microplus]